MQNWSREDRIAFLAELPLVDLHRHFDGSVRPQTLWNLSQTYYSAIPGLDFDGFRAKLTYDPEKDSTLLDYLDKFHIPLQYTQFFDNIQTIAEEIADDAYAEGIRLLELRINPTIHRRAGLTSRQCLTAVRKGLRASQKRHPDLQVGIIVIAMRNHGGNMAKILLREVVGEKMEWHSDIGVVGYDIAGPERPFPPLLFEEPFKLAKKMGFKRTVHAGEDEGPHAVWQAIDLLDANRIGHGTSAALDPKLVKRLAADQIAVEVCMTSNLQTGAVKDLKEHPLPLFLEAGIPVCISTDNPTVSGVTLRDEYLLAIELFGLSEADVRKLVRFSHEHAFIPSKAPLPA